MSRSLESTPSLREILFFKRSDGQNVRILEEIGARYRNFGMLLLDVVGDNVTDYIAAEKHHNVAEINREILSRWVNKEGKLPVTWATLIGVLEDIGCAQLAQTIRDNLTTTGEHTSKAAAQGRSQATVGKTSGLLDAVISDGDICKIAAVYLVNWEELSPVLGLNPPAGAAILNSFKDYGTQKREVLRKWKALKGDAATYNALIVAAENISNRQLAHEVRRMEKNPDEEAAKNVSGNQITAPTPTEAQSTAQPTANVIGQPPTQSTPMTTASEQEEDMDVDNNATDFGFPEQGFQSGTLDARGGSGLSKPDLVSKRGIAILVTCDYKDKRGKELPEDAMKTCAETMRNTFDKLGYQIYEKYNVTRNDITSLLQFVGENLREYKGKSKNDDGSEKVIVFAFSGHGGPAEGEGSKYSDSLAMETCNSDNVQCFYLKSDVMERICVENVQDIPTLFFINACRGTDTLYQKPAARQGDIVVEGNYRIDYSTISGHVAFAEKEWVPQLARTLLTEKKNSIQHVAAIVRKNIAEKEKERNTAIADRQISESRDRLVTGPLYLHRMKDRN